VAAEEGSMESGWAELPEELLTKVLEALLSSVRLRTEAGWVQGLRWCTVGGSVVMTRW
jgi:hypothetical protein